MSEPNPFETPRGSLANARQPTGKPHSLRRLVPTVIFGLLGCSSLSLGLSRLLSLARLWVDHVQPDQRWYVSLFLFFWAGVCWILASWLYLHRRRHLATVAAAMGFALPIAWEVMIRMR